MLLSAPCKTLISEDLLFEREEAQRPRPHYTFFLPGFPTNRPGGGPLPWALPESGPLAAASQVQFPDRQAGGSAQLQASPVEPQPRGRTSSSQR